MTNRQSVELEITRSPGAKPAVRKASGRNEPIRVTIGAPEGTFPGIGVSLHPDLIDEALAHPTLLDNLRPQLLLFHFDPTAGHGQSHLRGFADIAKCVPENDKTESVLELVLPAKESVREELLRRGCHGSCSRPAFDGQSWFHPRLTVDRPCPAAYGRRARHSARSTRQRGRRFRAWPSVGER